jgi:putative phosphoribosyl transferase
MNHPNDLDVSKIHMNATIEITGALRLEADLIMPLNPIGVVLIVHGNHSSRLSSRNRFVARMLAERDLGALLLDAETSEERERNLQNDNRQVEVEEMASRILLATDWLQSHPLTASLSIGYLGAGAGAAAAFVAAAQRADVVRAIVSRGGRLELARPYLPSVKGSALLIVGARDTSVVHNNRDALDRLGSIAKSLEIIPGADHQFEEPGALDAVAMHASNWLARYVPKIREPKLSHAAVHLDS